MTKDRRVKLLFVTAGYFSISMVLVDIILYYSTEPFGYS